MIDGLVRGVQNPLCPAGATQPISAEHRLRNAILDDMYRSLPKDANGDITEAAEAAYNAAAYGEFDDRMRLYHHGTGNIIIGQQILSVGSWFYRCPVCGLTLPAQIESQFPEVRR